MARLRLRVGHFGAALLSVSCVFGGCTARLTGDDGAASEGVPVSLPTTPGVVTLRRLTHAEYDNTVRDLLGTSLRPSIDFPGDDLGEEFDTVGSALTLSPLYVIAYERAAQALASDLLARQDGASRAILGCDVTQAGEPCARTILQGLAPRAFRRPVETTEVEQLLGPYRTAQALGAAPRDGLQASLAALLLSPSFLFKLELDPAPDSGDIRALNGYELATRLSYALWSTMPDEELFTWAKTWDPSDEASLALVLDRMLGDPRARAFADAFAASWLGYRGLEEHEVEATLFPAYQPSLARDFQSEASLFFQEFLNSDRPVEEMLSAGFSYMNPALAAHYGVTLPLGPPATAEPAGFMRVDTASTTRSGLLTLGAVLTSTSFAARTSPVRRGHFVFTRLLCGTVRPPPPGVEGLPVDATGLTLRQRLEVHRASPSCKSCHTVMDPLGFALEEYDAIGRYRELDEGVAIDATGELPDGRTFDGTLELGQLLAEGDEFSSCLTRKFLTFAVGRLFEKRDTWPTYLNQQIATTDGSVKSILRTALTSAVFRSRQAGATLD